MLLDDDQDETITPENLDNSSSSQVQFNLIPSSFNDASNGPKLNLNIHPSSSSSTSNYHQKMHLLHNQQQKLYNENVATTCKTLRNQKLFDPIIQNRLAINCDLDNQHDNQTVTYNPYANENDHDTKFQLSKSQQYQNELNQNRGPIEIPLVRRFGQDRTNFYNILPKVDTNSNKRLTADCGVTKITNTHSRPSSSMVNQQQFNCFSFKDRISISSHYSKNETTQAQLHNTLPSNENSQSNDSQSTFAFKNYDLNDEFWLNFDQ